MSQYTSHCAAHASRDGLVRGAPGGLRALPAASARLGVVHGVATLHCGQAEPCGVNEAEEQAARGTLDRSASTCRPANLRLGL